MKTFAYVVTPLNPKQLKEHWPLLRCLPDSILKFLGKLLPKYKIVELGKFKSVRGNTIKGYKIVYPILNEYKQEHLVLEKILSACHIAEKLGVQLIGFASYAALAADKNYNKIIKNIKIPVTSGNAFSAWCLFEEVYRRAKIKNILLKSSTLVILGADNEIGAQAARKLAGYAGKIIITGKDGDKLIKLKEMILHENPIEIVIESDIEKVSNEADIVVCADEIYIPGLKLKKGAIYCDLAKLSVKEYREKGDKFIHPSLAEAVLLLLDGKIVSYSLGEDSNLDKLEEIADIAVQHGFEVWVPEAPVL